MLEAQNILAYLEDNCDDPVVVLYKSGLSCDDKYSAFSLFLDLIWWSQENLGGTLYGGYGLYGLEYVEANYLGDALKFYANFPSECNDTIKKIIELKGGNY
jgi:hypothetical protein